MIFQFFVVIAFVMILSTMKSGPFSIMQGAAIRLTDRFLEDSIKLYPSAKPVIVDGHGTFVNTHLDGNAYASHESN